MISRSYDRRLHAVKADSASELVRPGGRPI